MSEANRYMNLYVHDRRMLTLHRRDGRVEPISTGVDPLDIIVGERNAGKTTALLGLACSTAADGRTGVVVSYEDTRVLPDDITHERDHLVIWKTQGEHPDHNSFRFYVSVRNALSVDAVVREVVAHDAWFLGLDRVSTYAYGYKDGDPWVQWRDYMAEIAEKAKSQLGHGVCVVGTIRATP